MIQRASRACFAFETNHGIGPTTLFRRKDLDSDVTFESSVSGAINLAHAALPQMLKNLIIAETRSQR
jgi:hypothetical protein